jgi:SAM-dependent methyltransferase
MTAVHSTAVPVAATAFDRVAHNYDELFTRTAIGSAQRRQVWTRLLTAFQPGQEILELNCGTGEDARFLVERGISVTACDASPVMIDVAKRRSRCTPDSAKLEFLRLANEELHRLSAGHVFDGAFSNFSGLNCLEDLTLVARNLATLVKPGGRVLLCLWSRVCLFEILWHALQGQLSKAFRRFSAKPAASIGGIKIPVSYPTAGEISRAFSPWFTLEGHRAIGLFVPPSYVDPWMRRHEKLLARLEAFDRCCSPWPLFCNVGDHLLLEFVRCHL